jgi:hypothetical protein
MARRRVSLAFPVWPSALAVALVACGGANAQPGADERIPTSGGSAPVNEPAAEIDPQICASDADCMVGTPRNCCVSWCPEDAVAWSRSAWASYQAECAVEECAETEQLACRPQAGPSRIARCVSERCVLSPTS